MHRILENIDRVVAESYCTIRRMGMILIVPWPYQNNQESACVVINKIISSIGNPRLCISSAVHEYPAKRKPKQHPLET